MEIPIELFLGGIAVSIAIGIFGFIRNPQIPAMLCFGGAFILLLSVSTTSLLMDGFAIQGSEIQNLPYNVLTFSFERSIFSDAVGDRSIIAEFVSSSSSTLYNQEINCYEVWLRKTGTPPSSDIIFGVYDANGVKKYEFGRFSSDLLTTSHTPYKECNTSVSYTTISLDRIGIEYDAGDASNAPSIRLDALNPYDGVITFQQDYNDVSNTWTSFTANDVMGIMSLEDNDPTTILNDSYEFTELPKTFFALIGGTMILLGALMVIKE